MISVQQFLRQRPDRLLFHYTNATGLIGILREQQLWATNALHLNDSSEFVDAMGRLVHHTKRRITESSTFEKNWNELHEEWETKGKRLANNVFVVSFSTEGNQLSQWRSYCPDGNGYSLGFSLADLAYAEKCQMTSRIERTPNTFLIRCVYDSEKQHKVIRLLADYIESAWKRAKSGKNRYYAASPIYRRVFAALLSIKNSGFSEECEWRLVSFLDTPQLSFRAGRFGVTPFVRIPLCEEGDQMTLDKIWIGPNLESDAAGTALRQLLTSNNVKGTQGKCELRRSEIPYRY